MKKKIKYNRKNEKIEKEVNYIPVRYIFAALITIFEILIIIGIVVALCIVVPYFFIPAIITQLGCAIKIIASDDNPDYKIPWLLFVLILPVAGFMLYFLFYSRSVKKKFVKRMAELKNIKYDKDDSELFDELGNDCPIACSQAKMLCKISNAHIFKNVGQTYFPLGEDMFKSMLEDLKRASKFILLEFFIIEEGFFWNSVLEILKQKVKEGVMVKVVFDDIGCMKTLPGDYSKTLKSFGILATPFSRLKGNADSEFNNRNHRKIMVIDGVVGYTGGINIADEYINKVTRFGHWKDVGLRLEGEAVWELTRLFNIDFGINFKTVPKDDIDYFPNYDFNGSENNLNKSKSKNNEGYFVPFGDGPKVMFNRRVGKSVIQNMFSSATKYAYIMTPYLIIDNDLCQSIENAAMRGADVKIILPHIPDKKIVFGMTKSFYARLMSAGVKIYEYEPGFIHAKSYLIDGNFGLLGTMNLDYRSLVHHFENGVFMYKVNCLAEMKIDFEKTLDKCIIVTEKMRKINLFQRFTRSLVRIFAPLL